jgi:DNA-binding NarL/FixJ family response regulator
MSEIRILLAQLPQIMRETIRHAVDLQSDMAIVGEYPNPLELLLAARELEAAAVIVAIENSEMPGWCSHLFAEFPHITILGLTPTGAMAFIEQLCPRRREILDPTEVNIISALRHAVREPCGSEADVN